MPPLFLDFETVQIIYTLLKIENKKSHNFKGKNYGTWGFWGITPGVQF